MPANALAWHRSCPAALELGNHLNGAVSSPELSQRSARMIQQWNGTAQELEQLRRPSS